jgi:hypothetical protein
LTYDALGGYEPRTHQTVSPAGRRRLVMRFTLTLFAAVTLAVSGPASADVVTDWNQKARHQQVGFLAVHLLRGSFDRIGVVCTTRSTSRETATGAYAG